MASVTGQKDMFRNRILSGLSAHIYRTKIPDKKTCDIGHDFPSSTKNGGKQPVFASLMADKNTSMEFCPARTIVSAPTKDATGHNPPHPIVGGIYVRVSGGSRVASEATP